MWLRNPGGALRLVVCALAAAAVTACGGAGERGPAAADLERSSEPPFDLGAGFRVAGRGDDLVVIQNQTDRVAIRWADDSTWSALPAIAGEGYYEYVTIGPTVVAGGYTCGSGFTDGYCAEATTAVFRLAEDLTEWTRLDLPEMSVTSEAELTGSIGPQSIGEFQIDGTAVVVDSAGKVTVGEVGSYGESGFACLVDGTTVDMAARPADGVPGLTGQPVGAEVVYAVATRPTDDRIAEWDLVDLDPGVALTPFNGRICGAGHVAIIPTDGSTEWVVDVADRTVEAVESNSALVVGAPGFQRPGGQAESPDGRTLYMASTSGGIAERTDMAMWEDLGVPFGGVWATESAVWTFDEASSDFVQLPPPA